MAQARPRHSAAKNSRKTAFPEEPFELSRPLMQAATVALAGIAALLAIGAFLGQQHLADRQAAGAQRVLDSLGAESSVLEEKWRQGEVPATLLQAEQEHIADESSQAAEQLSALSQEGGDG